ncbi:Mitochondrial ribosomal protein subunit L28 [Gigaspora margarita]|uniref:Large ribosomal subunit protein mL40 n=1 Tax=Gigaspora margarita TaxID=4874 RepID=A0A8H4APG7_GIGMA|nr:Mitochondrial ribosomal protein subunit L28 [Gigaspora margarita]
MSNHFSYRSALSTSIRGILARTVKKSKPKSEIPGSQNANITDTRYQIIKRILYETPKTELPKMTEQDLERHETIDRAWKLFLRNQQEERENELAAKYRKLNEANLELEKLGPRLFNSAQIGNKIMMFPRQMKIPTETPPLNGWNYDYKPLSSDPTKNSKPLPSDPIKDSEPLPSNPIKDSEPLPSDPNKVSS